MKVKRHSLEPVILNQREMLIKSMVLGQYGNLIIDIPKLMGQLHLVAKKR